MVRGRLVYGGRRLTDRNHRLKYGSMFGIIKKTWGFIPKSFRESVRILAFVIWAVQGSKHVIFAVKAGQGADETKHGHKGMERQHNGICYGSRYRGRTILKEKSSMGNVKRVYVEKKEPFAVKARELKEEIGSYLGIGGVQDVRVFIRYDVENL